MTVENTEVFVGGRRVAEHVSPADGIRDARERGGFVWIGLRGADLDELHDLAGRLNLHPLAVAESLRGHQRAKLEHLGDVTFMVLQPARYVDESETVEFMEVDVFVGPDFIVTVIEDDVLDVNTVRERLEQHPEIMAKGIYAVVWAILEFLINAYGPVIDGVENDIDEIEEELFSRDEHVAERIFKLQREVIDLQHATSPLGDILDRMQRIVTQAMGTEEAPAFREVDDRARHIDGKVTGFRQTLDNALTVNATLADQARNDEMRRLTEFGIQQNDQVKKVSSWAAILFAPTLVGTIYGMNFDNMPELGWQFGYPIALLAMLCTSVTLYIVFKRRGWL